MWGVAPGRILSVVVPILVASAIASLGACSSTTRQRSVLGRSWPEFQKGARFVVLGDVQRTSKLELWREKNDAERARILEAVADIRPDFVAFTGDLVFDGGSDDHWAEFDRLSGALRARAVPVVTAFGNHEYWGGRASAERNVFARFPVLGRQHWYAFPFGPLRLLVLDSNDAEMTKAEWTAQRTWYEHALAEADASPEVRGVVVLLHHPPFTNSTVTSDEPAVKEAFLPDFLGSKKTLAMLSGHVHSYERFGRARKVFVVSGGGGGPRAELATGAARPHPDDLFDGPAIRDFHFTVYSVGPRGLSAEVQGLAKGSRELHTMDRFELAFPDDLEARDSARE
jgi:predicted MPP superfamily phosphohydrolase